MANDERTIHRLTAQTFKQRYNSHQHSMRDRKYRSITSLSKHVWALKDQGIEHIQWSVQLKATEYENTTNRCSLCLAEKVEIISAGEGRSLNKRTELISNAGTKTSSICQTFSHQCLSALVLSSCTLSMLVLTFSVLVFTKTLCTPHISHHTILSSCTKFTYSESGLVIPKPLHFTQFPQSQSATLGSLA